MKPWLEMSAVLLIVGAAVAWAVRRLLSARRAAASASPCDSCGQVGACPAVQSGEDSPAAAGSSVDSTGETSCPKP